MKISNTAGIQPYEKYEADIVIDRIDREGDAESKKPIILNCRFEQSGNNLRLTTWEYGALENFKKIVENHHVCNISFTAKIYNESISFNLSTYRDTGKITKLESKEISVNFYESEINKMIEMVKNNNYKKLLKDLITSDFYVWPAAYSVHHAFAGGLALHSYSVAKTSMYISDVYKNSNIDMDVLITGSLLHDIGKLLEYTKTGKITMKGQLFSHIVLGIEMIDKSCEKLNINQDGDDILKLKHIIASHHGKLEFGSPITPKTIEAFIVSQADNGDSKIEAIQEAFDASDNSYLNEEEFTGPIKALEGGKVLLPKKK